MFFHLIRANGFPVHVDNERINTAGSFCRQNLKFESFHVADYVKEIFQS